MFRTNWMHLTDLHVGMTDQDWLWPGQKNLFFDDLRRQAERMKQLRFLIFSGDLVQKGSKTEFDKLDEILVSIWDVLRDIGSNPLLFHIPGNHDLARPDSRDPAFLALSKWWETPEVREDFFDGKYEYKNKILKIFEEYSSWSSGIEDRIGIQTVAVSSGILPGDCSGVVEIDDYRVGIIGLNSTWLQFAGDNRQGKLAVDPKQILSVTDFDPRNWCDGNHFNILVTHHPVDWLHQHNKTAWNNDIFPPGRFDLHLHGHMHESESSSVSRYGSLYRNTVQGAALFGLEHYDGSVSKRLQGYSTSQLKIENGGLEVRVWPRIAREAKSGTQLLGPDQDFELAEDNSYLAITRGASGPELKKKQREIILAPEVRETTLVGDSSAVKGLRYYLPSRGHHDKVRQVSADQASRAFSQHRICWVSAEWAMAADEFLSAIFNTAGSDDFAAYRIDASEFVTKESFLDEIRSLYVASFEKICDALLAIGKCCLIFDDIPTRGQRVAGRRSVEEELEEIASIAIQYCPNLVVVLRSRIDPFGNRLPMVRLQEFDEADLKTYVDAFGDRYSDISSELSIRKLHRHTDGVPKRVDAALLELKVIPLSELTESNSDLVLLQDTTPSRGPKNPILTSIMALKQPDDPNPSRTLELLKVLSIFPKGEQLIRVKRFYGVHGFHSYHATELLATGLVESTTFKSVDANQSEEPARTLVVPRLAREEIRNLISPAEFQELNRRAADIYFGSDWINGTLHPSSGYKFENPHCSSNDIINASALIIRMMRYAEESDDERNMSAVLNLTSMFASTLRRGDHFAGLVVLLEDVCRLVPSEKYESKVTLLKAHLASGLRMLGEHEKARDLILSLDLELITNAQRQHALLDLLLCYEKLSDAEEVEKIWLKILSINKKTVAVWHAKSVVLRLQPSSADIDKKLRTLETYCRRHNAVSVANEIALSRVESNNASAEEIVHSLAPVIQSTSNRQNFYVRLRAHLRLAKIMLDERGELPQEEVSGLVAAYHYLFNERLGPLFDRCSDLLWKQFEARGDIENLLRLFKHSSLYWRLRGQQDKERKYALRARSLVSGLITGAGSETEQNLTYYKLRDAEFHDD